MKDRLLDALKKSTADYAEVRFERSDGTHIAFRGPETETAVSGCHEGGLVRACKDGGWGISVFDSLSDLDFHVSAACESAYLTGREKTRLAEADFPTGAVVTAEMKRDFRGISLDDKLALVNDYNALMLKKDSSVESTHCSYAEQFRTVHFASSRGAYYMEERPRMILSLGAIARDGNLVQRAHESYSSTDDFEVMLGREGDAEAVALRAVDLLSAPQCDGGRRTVILNPAFAGVFVHEAFGHLSEADFLYENPEMRELMYIGREMGVDTLNIVDDGSLARLIGTQSFDDEGTPTGKTYLIKDGLLAGHLHSLETAAVMGEDPTGNARAINRSSEPIVRMTNTYLEAGGQTERDLFAGVDDGIYACDMFGGQTMMEMFTFSAAYGYRIRNGERAELLRDIVISGNVFETLYAVDGLADDFAIKESGGGCGKGGQSSLPVTFGAPHVRIQNLVVGGK